VCRGPRRGELLAQALDLECELLGVAGALGVGEFAGQFEQAPVQPRVLVSQQLRGLA